MSFLEPHVLVMVAIYLPGCVTVMDAPVAPVLHVVVALPVLSTLEKLPQYVVSLPRLKAFGIVIIVTLMVSVEVQPSDVTRTQYMPAWFTVIVGELAPVLQV